MSSYGGYGRSGAGPNAELRRRNVENSQQQSGASSWTPEKARSKATVVKNLDFMFPKVDTEFTVKTEGGGMTSVIAYCLLTLLILAEGMSWLQQNAETVERISVDTALGKKMRVNMNMTFPALACEDLHVDVMDVAGDSQIDIIDTLIKRRLNRRGDALGDVQKVDANLNQQRHDEKTRVLKEDVPENYCGPCYGADEKEGDCCNTCDELLEKYKLKKWRSEVVQATSEQCIREGRDKMEPKKLKKGEGCNLSGYLLLNRVAGNFHIAMGEGIERDGRHIHTFNPEETPDFNASHIIHDLSFGPTGARAGFGEESQTTLNGVSKIVTKQHGTTGLFQYFIKVVPTTFVSTRGVKVDTNAYFFTERFRPLMKEYLEDEKTEDEGDGTVSVPAGHGSKEKHENHNIRNAVLPGVFFIYEIYPFAVEIQKKTVPFTHLVIRLMATVGGVFTMFRWADSLFFSRKESGRR